ncbi:hypothetical protein WJX74_005594 [Apatococcus lobatus]|uniref:Poly [ADP-ribose] polymerase n=1 Tax=Apatococcus lobatus TaxID=904363 RepID=A0AAW1QCA4_9CHLO
MPPVLRKRGTPQPLAGGSADPESLVDLVSPSTGPSGAVQALEPASDHPTAKKRQKNSRVKQLAEELLGVAQPSSRSRGRRPASADAAQTAAADPAPAAGSTEQAKASQQPPWKKQRGVKRVMAEFKSISQNPGTQLSHLEMVNDNALKWQFRVANFDDDVPAGRKLNEDLHKLALAHGQDYLLMEATFPADYPEKPFFLRVLSPRCRMYTGHVTAGGSICIEALTLSGSPGSWQAAYCFESVIQLVLTNMIHCESVMVRTATGPGGRSGPLRVDLHMGNRVMQPYSEWEAQAAFERMMNHHRTNGWGGGDAGGAGPSRGPARNHRGSGLRGDGFRLHDQFESFRQRIDGARSLEPGEASGGLASWTSADALPWASQLAHSMLAQPSSASPAGDTGRSTRAAAKRPASSTEGHCSQPPRLNDTAEGLRPAGPSQEADHAADNTALDSAPSRWPSTGAPEQRSTGCWRDVPVDPASLSRVRWEPSSPRVTRHDAFDEAPAWPSAESSDAARSPAYHSRRLAYIVTGEARQESSKARLSPGKDVSGAALPGPIIMRQRPVIVKLEASSHLQPGLTVPSGAPATKPVLSDAFDLPGDLQPKMSAQVQADRQVSADLCRSHSRLWRTRQPPPPAMDVPGRDTTVPRGMLIDEDTLDSRLEAGFNAGSSRLSGNSQPPASGPTSTEPFAATAAAAAAAAAHCKPEGHLRGSQANAAPSLPEQAPRLIDWDATEQSVSSMSRDLGTSLESGGNPLAPVPMQQVKPAQPSNGSLSPPSAAQLADGASSMAGRPWPEAPMIEHRAAYRKGIDKLKYPWRACSQDESAVNDFQGREVPSSEAQIHPRSADMPNAAVDKAPGLQQPHQADGSSLGKPTHGTVDQQQQQASQHPQSRTQWPTCQLDAQNPPLPEAAETEEGRSQRDQQQLPTHASDLFRDRVTERAAGFSKPFKQPRFLQGSCSSRQVEKAVQHIPSAVRTQQKSSQAWAVDSIPSLLNVPKEVAPMDAVQASKAADPAHDEDKPHGGQPSPMGESGLDCALKVLQYAVSRSSQNLGRLKAEDVKPALHSNASPSVQLTYHLAKLSTGREHCEPSKFHPTLQAVDGTAEKSALSCSLLAKQVTLSQESDKAIPSPPWLKGIHQSQDLQDNQAFPDLVPIARPSGPQARLSVTLPKFAQSFGCTASQPEGLGDLYGRQDGGQRTQVAGPMKTSRENLQPAGVHHEQRLAGCWMHSGRSDDQNSLRPPGNAADPGSNHALNGPAVEKLSGTRPANLQNNAPREQSARGSSPGLDKAGHDDMARKEGGGCMLQSMPDVPTEHCEANAADAVSAAALQDSLGSQWESLSEHEASGASAAGHQQESAQPGSPSLDAYTAGIRSKGALLALAVGAATLQESQNPSATGPGQEHTGKAALESQRAGMPEAGTQPEATPAHMLMACSQAGQIAVREAVKPMSAGKHQAGAQPGTCMDPDPTQPSGTLQQESGMAAEAGQQLDTAWRGVGLLDAARQTNAAVPQAGFQPDTAKAVGGGHLQREEQEADSVPRRHSSICGGLGLMSWAKGSGKAKPSRQLESSVADGLSPQLLSAAEAEASDLSREAQLVTGKTKAPMRTKPHSGMGATFKSAFEPRKRRSSAPLSRIAPGTAGVISLDSEEEEDDFMTFLRGMDLPAATRRKRDAPSGLSDLISTADAVQTDGMATLTDARHLRHTARTPSHVDRPAGKDEDQALDRVTGDLIPDKCEDVEVFSLPKRKRQRHPIIEGLSEDDPFPECAESTLQDEVDNMSASDAARMFREEATQRRDGKKSRTPALPLPSDVRQSQADSHGKDKRTDADHVSAIAAETATLRQRQDARRLRRQQEAQRNATGALSQLPTLLQDDDSLLDDSVEVVNTASQAASRVWSKCAKVPSKQAAAVAWGADLRNRDSGAGSRGKRIKRAHETEAELVASQDALEQKAEAIDLTMDLAQVDFASQLEQMDVELQAPAAAAAAPAMEAEMQKMQAMKEKLQQEIEALERQKQVNALAVPPPDHWLAVPNTSTVYYLPLPFEGGAAPAEPQLDASTVHEMTRQGLSEEDARAALLECGGDGDAALVFAVQCMEAGGAAQVRFCRQAGEAAAVANSGDTCARNAALTTEVESVLRRFTEGNLTRSMVRGIERIQNAKLWAKYSLRRAEVSEARAGNPNEMMLFHGADRDTLRIICEQGVDLRESNAGGALGQGSYFAWASVYSDRYTRGGPRGAAAALAPAAARGIFPPGIPPPVMPSGGGALPSSFMASMGLPSWAAFANPFGGMASSGAPPPLPMGPPPPVGGTSGAWQMHQAKAAKLRQTLAAQGAIGVAPNPIAAPPVATGKQAFDTIPRATRSRTAAETAASVGGRGRKGRRGRPAAEAAAAAAAAAMVPVPPLPAVAAGRHTKKGKRLKWPAFYGPSGLPADIPEAASSLVGLGGLQLQPNCGLATRSMLLCRVSLGVVAQGHSGCRKPPPGHDSVSNSAGSRRAHSAESIWAIFDNHQAYPEYIIHYDSP